MRKFLIASHGHLASGMKSALDILLGASNHVAVLDAYVDETRVEDKINEFYQQVDESDQVILLSDLVGGSVNQMMYPYAARKDTILISGINLALVLELAAAADQPITDEMIDQTIAMSQTMMQRVYFDDSTEIEEEEFF